MKKMRIKKSLYRITLKSWFNVWKQGKNSNKTTQSMMWCIFPTITRKSMKIKSMWTGTKFGSRHFSTSSCSESIEWSKLNLTILKFNFIKKKAANLDLTNSFKKMRTKIMNWTARAKSLKTGKSFLVKFQRRCRRTKKRVDEQIIRGNIPSKEQIICLRSKLGLGAAESRLWNQILWRQAQIQANRGVDWKMHLWRNPFAS